MFPKIFLNASTTNVFVPHGTNSKPFVREAHLFNVMEKRKRVLRDHNISGKRFGKWVVLNYSHEADRFKYFLCRCDCGNEKIIQSYTLIKGMSTSCGCPRYGDESNGYKHGKRRHRLYYIWNGMRQRCKNGKLDSYKNYGGRGISICKEWDNSFVSFYNWSISNGYSESLEIDRINNNGNYEPSNCRWATVIQQAYNRRNNVLLEYEGEKLSPKDMAKKYNVDIVLFRSRMYRGWNVERIICENKHNN